MLSRKPGDPWWHIIALCINIMDDFVTFNDQACDIPCYDKIQWCLTLWASLLFEILFPCWRCEVGDEAEGEFLSPCSVLQSHCPRAWGRGMINSITICCFLVKWSDGNTLTVERENWNPLQTCRSTLKHKVRVELVLPDLQDVNKFLWPL